MPDTDKSSGEKKEGLLQSLKHTKFSAGSIALILIGFTCTGTFQLWLNCAQNFAKDVAGWAEPQAMQSFYAIGTMIGLIITALLTSKIKDVRFVMIYPAVCALMMVAVLMAPSQGMLKIGAFVLGWFGAGGLLQIATSVCNMLFPKIKGTVTALVMIASSLCNYTILTAAAQMTPSGVMTMNIVLTAIGVLLGLFVNKNYAKMLEAAEADA
jgi:predicted MFS family arabinose efflux permease